MWQDPGIGGGFEGLPRRLSSLLRFRAPFRVPVDDRNWRMSLGSLINRQMSDAFRKARWYEVLGHTGRGRCGPLGAAVKAGAGTNVIVLRRPVNWKRDRP